MKTAVDGRVGVGSDGIERVEESVVCSKMKKVVCKSCFKERVVPKRGIEILNAIEGECACDISSGVNLHVKFRWKPNKQNKKE